MQSVQWLLLALNLKRLTVSFLMIFVKQEYVPRGTCWLAEFNTCNLTYPQRGKKMIIIITNNGMKKKKKTKMKMKKKVILEDKVYTR